MRDARERLGKLRDNLLCDDVNRVDGVARFIAIDGGQ